MVTLKNVKSDLIAGSGKIVNGLQENLVAILKSADVVDGGL